MSNSKYGVKSQLISELIAITYLFGNVLTKKYLLKGNETGFFSIIISLIIWGAFWIYNKKHNDVIDELSKNILAKVNNIITGVILYNAMIIGIYFGTSYSQHVSISNLNIGIMIFAIVFILSILRLSLFIYFDRRGIYK